jgi:hypothetical protein
VAEPVVPTEPVAPTEPKNDDGAGAAPSTPANDEAAQLRKELEQAKMRANQLENEKRESDKAKADADRKALEDQNEYKKLFEKSDAELKAIREREENAVRSAELAKVSEGVLKDYPKEVQELAETAGLTLNDESEVSRTAFKEKLDAIAKRIVPGQTATPNNPSNLPTPNVQESDLPDELRPTDTTEFTGKGGRVVTQMAFAGAKNDPTVIRSYVSKLGAVDQMRKDSGYTRTEA